MSTQLKENIVSVVKQKGWSIRKLERDAGLTKNYLSNLLRNESINPTIDSVAKIAAVLNISIDELFGNKKKPEYKVRDLVIAHKDLFYEIVNYLLTAINTEPKKEIKFEKFVDAMCEIYLFSLKKGAIHKKFADWYINTQL